MTLSHAFGEMEHGNTFPPRDAWDIAFYDNDEVVAGYQEASVDDPYPGPNRSPSYRWGWANRIRDVTGRSDGFDAIRRDYIVMKRRAT